MDILVSYNWLGINLATWVGIFGAFIILLAFLMNQTKRWLAESLVYDAVNFFGSGLLVLYAVLTASIPFIILNGVWAVVSLKDIFADLKRKVRGKL